MHLMFLVLKMARPRKIDDGPAETATVRVSKALLDELDPYAREANRSLSKEVEHRLRASLLKDSLGTNEEMAADKALLARFETLLQTLDLVAEDHWSYSASAIDALRRGFSVLLEEGVRPEVHKHSQPSSTTEQTGEIVGKIAASGLRDDLCEIAKKWGQAFGNEKPKRKE